MGGHLETQASVPRQPLWRFSLDRHRLPVFEVADENYQPLGAWIIADISVYLLVCLDALAMIDDVSHGRPPFEQWSSDNYDVSITPQGFSFRNRWIDEQGQYSVDEAREAFEEYWRFLSSQPERTHLIREYRPDLPEWQADLLRWEEKWNRTHPYRGRLF